MLRLFSTKVFKTFLIDGTDYNKHEKQYQAPNDKAHINQT
jgi:hypothetical protein